MRLTTARVGQSLRREASPDAAIIVPAQAVLTSPSDRAHAQKWWRVLTGNGVLAVLLVLGCGGAPLVTQDGPLAESARPAWVVDGVPDAVWMAVEAAIAAKDKDKTRELLEGAEVQARSALKGHEGEVGRRFALAVVLGLRAEREGGKTKIAIASELKKELDATLALDPDHGRARHMRGRLNAGVLRMNRLTRWIATSMLGGGELKKATWPGAERDLAFAEITVPEVGDHHLQLAYLYRDTKRPELALIEAGHALALPRRTALERTVYDQALQLREKLGARY